MAKVLLVDDDPVVRDTIQQILIADDHAVTLAEDGRQAVDICKNAEFDLVITDIIMPEKDGIEIITELRRMRPTIRILAISGGGRIGNSDLLRVAEWLGAAGAVAKPFDPDDLIEKVASCLRS